jgi:hypothetical protein
MDPQLSCSNQFFRSVAQTTSQARPSDIRTAKVSDKDAILIQFRRELLGRHNVGADTYARAKATFGQQDLSDFVVNVMAPHARGDVLVTVFDQQLPPGQKSLLP